MFGYESTDSMYGAGKTDINHQYYSRIDNASEKLSGPLPLIILPTSVEAWLVVPYAKM